MMINSKDLLTLMMLCDKSFRENAKEYIQDAKLSYEQANKLIDFLSVLNARFKDLRNSLKDYYEDQINELEMENDDLEEQNIYLSNRSDALETENDDLLAEIKYFKKKWNY